MTDTEIINFIEAHSVDFFRMDADRHLHRSGKTTVALLRHYNPMAYQTGEGADLRSAVADLIAKNPSIAPHSATCTPQ